jgi:UDP-GlcNAc:undecaprenyl-phosphate GlcNAc-1-phosphate transferase
VHFGWLILVLAGAALAGALATRGHIAVARRFGLVAPKDPWHEEPPAQSAGVAVWIVVVVGVFALGLWRHPSAFTILLAALVLAVVGWVDDRRALQPTTKLMLQLTVTLGLIASSFGQDSRLHLALTLPLAVVWLVGQSNAVNLLDNMDGCGATVLTVSGLSVAVLQLFAGNVQLACFALLIAGASVGFLLFNLRPARAFLGDTGSLSLGFALAAIALQGSWVGEGARLARLALPPLAMIVPILNTAFVVMTRFDAGVPVSRGLADHVNYRLVAHGWSVERALVAVGIVGALGGVLAASWWLMPLPVWGGFSALSALGIVYFAIFLSHADVNDMYRRFGIPFKPPRTSDYRLARRRAFELLSDVVVASSAFFFAFELRFEGDVPQSQQLNLIRGLPPVVVVCLLAIWTSGVYRSFWKYVGVEEIMRLARASAVVAAVMFGARLLPFFDSFPRSVCILCPLLFGVFAASYRLSLRLMHEARHRAQGAAASLHKAILVGAGDAGVLALKDLRGSELSPVGFLDDDPAKIGLEIRGMPVLGPTAALATIARALGASVAVVSMPSAPKEKIDFLLRAASSAGLEVRVFTPSHMEPVSGHLLALPEPESAAPRR